MESVSATSMENQVIKISKIEAQLLAHLRNAAIVFSSIARDYGYCGHQQPTNMK